MRDEWPRTNSDLDRTNQRRERSTVSYVAEIAFCLLLLALFVHSLFYSAFFEDPLTWAVLAVAAAAVAAQRVQAPAPEAVHPTIASASTGEPTPAS
jgi:hypothetical protein